jgi:hypothetical protein
MKKKRIVLSIAPLPELNRLRKNPLALSFWGAAGDRKSRMFMKMRKARSFAQFILSGRARFFAAVKMAPFLG